MYNINEATSNAIMFELCKTNHGMDLMHITPLFQPINKNHCQLYLMRYLF
jgi:hypothetical protein